MSLPMFAGLVGIGLGVILFVSYYYNRNQAQTSSHSYSNDEWCRNYDEYSQPADFSSENVRRRGKRDGEDDTCIICVESFSHQKNDYMITNCKHKFHIKCLNRWLEEKSICPLCRKSL